MNFLDSFKSGLTSDPLNFLGILVTVIASIYIFRSENSLSLNKERHDKLIFPLFDILEPILFKEVDAEILGKALGIIESNKNLMEGKLFSIYYFCKENPCQENFISLCSYVNSRYDKSCRMLKLKPRTIEYRIIREQYKNKFNLLVYMSVYVLIAAFTFFVFLLFFLFVAAIFKTLGETFYNSLEIQNQIIFLLMCLVCLFAIVKFIEKHH